MGWTTYCYFPFIHRNAKNRVGRQGINVETSQEPWGAPEKSWFSLIEEVGMRESDIIL